MANDHPANDGQPPCLPPETYNYLIHALLSLQPHPTFHPPPLPNYTYPWPPLPPSFYANPLLPRAQVQAAGPSSVPATTSTAQESETSEDTASVAEDKRRRNTAASARFRVKKKLKTLNLERTVSDLTGRTDELEREAADLRRENAWLKEIVLLKGRHLATLNAPQTSEDGSGRRETDKGKERMRD